MSTKSEKWFRVEVSDHDGQVVAIETEMLAGRDIGTDECVTIRKAIAHLSGFIGESAPDLLAENERLREALTDLLRMVEGSLNDDVGPNSIDVGDPCEAEELCGSPRCEYGCVTLKIRNARAALQSR